MSVILPININNIDDISVYNNLTEYEKDLSFNGKVHIDDANNYDLLMSMYEQQYTQEIINNNAPTTDIDDITSSLMMI